MPFNERTSWYNMRELSIIHIVFDTKELTSTTSFLCCCSAFFPLIFFAHFSCLRLFLCVRLVCFALPCTSSAEDNLELQSFYDVLIVVDRCSYTYTFIAYDCTTSNSFFFFFFFFQAKCGIRMSIASQHQIQSNKNCFIVSDIVSGCIRWYLCDSMHQSYTRNNFYCTASSIRTDCLNGFVRAIVFLIVWLLNKNWNWYSDRYITHRSHSISIGRPMYRKRPFVSGWMNFYRNYANNKKK